MQPQLTLPCCAWLRADHVAETTRPPRQKYSLSGPSYGLPSRYVLFVGCPSGPWRGWTCLDLHFPKPEPLPRVGVPSLSSSGQNHPLNNQTATVPILLRAYLVLFMATLWGGCMCNGHPILHKEIEAQRCGVTGLGHTAGK